MSGDTVMHVLYEGEDVDIHLWSLLEPAEGFLDKREGKAARCQSYCWALAITPRLLGSLWTIKEGG
jgi:hypothetical protein